MRAVACSLGARCPHRVSNQQQRSGVPAAHSPAWLLFLRAHLQHGAGARALEPAVPLWSSLLQENCRAWPRGSKKEPGWSSLKPAWFVVCCENKSLPPRWARC